MLTYRDIVEDDAAELARLINLCRECSFLSKQSILNGLKRPRDPSQHRYWVATEGERIVARVGYGAHPYFGYLISVFGDPNQVTRSQAHEMLNFVLSMCPKSDVGPAITCSARFATLIAVVEDLGALKLCEEVSQRLDLRSYSSQGSAFEELRKQGLQFFNLREVIADDAKTRSFYELEIESAHDTPNFAQGIFPTYEDVVAEMKCREQTSSIVCFDGPRAVGFCNTLRLADTALLAAGTGVARTHRHRKIALAMKQLSAVSAIECGFEVICTLNEVTNVAMRNLNAKIGFYETGREATFRLAARLSSTLP